MKKIDIENIPQHIAIIMDGNGRWAKKRFLPRGLGHKEGVKAVERTLEAAGELGVKYLTLYAFSSENWTRPESEVSALMELLGIALDKYLPQLQKNGVALKIIGDYKKFPERVVAKLESVVEKTAENKNITLILALNYSGRWELTEAARKISKKVLEGALSLEQISPEELEKNLDTNFAPCPDLIIRTSGEQRISNFLLWQSAYSEFYFTPMLWPDFGKESLAQAIIDFQKRERRFGGIK